MKNLELAFVFLILTVIVSILAIIVSTGIEMGAL